MIKQIKLSRGILLFIILSILGTLFVINLNGQLQYIYGGFMTASYEEETDQLNVDKFIYISDSKSPESTRTLSINPSTSSSSSSIPYNYCPCKEIVSLPKSIIYVSQLNLTIPWYNLTTKEHLLKHHPNFPITITSSILKGRCHLMPAPHDMMWHNQHWQQVSVDTNTHYLLYSAYIDNRVLTDVRPCVRILVHSKNKNPTAPFCYLWFNASDPPVLSKVIRVEYMDWQSKSTSRYMTFLLTCRLPPEGPQIKPQAVSIVAKPCDKATNLLEVVGAMERNITKSYRGGKPPPNNSSHTGFTAAACGTALFYYLDDFSIRLVEWLEILRAMGFSQVFLHETDVHPNIRKVLQHYEEEGFLGITHHSYPEPYINEPSVRRVWYLMEPRKRWGMNVIYFSDCLLRHMHEYRFIAHIDPDEVPMFPGFNSYLSWMDSIIEKAVKYSTSKNKPMPAAYRTRWRYHVNDLPISEDAKDLPEYLWVLRHTKVPKKFVRGHNNNVKSLYDMDTTTGASAHEVLVCGSGKCRGGKFDIKPSQAYIGHFKDDHVCGKQCEKPGTYDDVPTLLQYKDQVKEAVAKVLKKLELLA